MMYLHTAFHFPDSSDWLVTAIKPKAKVRFHAKKDRKKFAHVLEVLLLYIIPGPYIKFCLYRSYLNRLCGHHVAITDVDKKYEFG
jgi:hypothetical protein